MLQSLNLLPQRMVSGPLWATRTSAAAGVPYDGDQCRMDWQSTGRGGKEKLYRRQIPVLAVTLAYYSITASWAIY